MKKLITSDYFDYDFTKRMISWHMKYYLFGRGTPLSAGIHITKKCNARCIMCNIWKIKDNPVYPIEKQKRDIDALSGLGCYYYSISGGEPTLVKDLVERLKYASERLPYVRLVTNGLSMTPELARALGESGIKDIGVSIDGLEEFHNKMRGLDYAFERAWNAVDLLNRYARKVKIIVNSLLTPYNIDDLKELKKRLDCFPDVQSKYLPISFHEIFGNKGQNSIDLMREEASAAEMEKFLDEAVADPKIVNSSYFLKKAKLYFRGEEDVIPEQRRCLFSYFAVEFGPNGAVYPCITGMGFKDGNSDADLRSFIGSNEFRKMQKELETCKKCRNNMMLCYYEPRLNFPLHNHVLSMIKCHGL